MRFIRNLAPLVLLPFACIWLGALVLTLLVVIRLFAVDRAVAVEAAPVVFATFETLGLGLAIFTWLAAMGWAWTAGSRTLWTIVALATVAFVLVGTQAMGVSPTMQRLRIAGEGGGDAFARLHALSNVLYLGQGLVVAAMAGLGFHALRRDPTCRLSATKA